MFDWAKLLKRRNGNSLMVAPRERGTLALALSPVSFGVLQANSMV